MVRPLAVCMWATLNACFNVVLWLTLELAKTAPHDICVEGKCGFNTRAHAHTQTIKPPSSLLEDS